MITSVRGKGLKGHQIFVGDLGVQGVITIYVMGISFVTISGNIETMADSEGFR